MGLILAVFCGHTGTAEPASTFGHLKFTETVSAATIHARVDYQCGEMRKGKRKGRRSSLLARCSKAENNYAASLTDLTSRPRPRGLVQCCASLLLATVLYHSAACAGDTFTTVFLHPQHEFPTMETFTGTQGWSCRTGGRQVAIEEGCSKSSSEQQTARTASVCTIPGYCAA